MCFAGYSSSHILSSDTKLDYQHQFVGSQAIGNALGWLEISPNTSKDITLQVVPFHLQIIQPIWSLDKDKATSLSAFGILNRSSFLVTFKSLHHDLNFSSISTLSPYSITAGVAQGEDSSFALEGKLDFYSVGNSGVGGESYGLLGGSFSLSNAQINFLSIFSDFSDAYGGKGRFDIGADSLIFFKEITAKNHAYGIYGEKLGEGSIHIQSLNAQKGNAHGVVGNVLGGRIKLDHIKSAQGYAYGIYNPSPSTIQATLEFGTLTSKKSFALYNTSLLHIKDSTLSFSSSPEIPIFSNGNLIISSSTLSFGATSSASISLSQGDVTFFTTSITLGGIHSTSSSNIIILDQGKLHIDTPLPALSGNLSLHLGEGAVFESTRSDVSIQKLQAKAGSKIILKGESAKLDIHDFSSSEATFSLKATPNTNASLEIHSSTARGNLHNQLYVDLDSISLTPKETILAKVPQTLANSVIFNSLYAHGDSMKSISYVGFDEAEIEIRREERDGAVYYITDLVAQNYKLNPIFILPTSLALNANHTLFLFSPTLSRMQENRQKKEHGIWGKSYTGEGKEKFAGISQISYFALQGGYDFNLCSLHSCNLIGVFLGYLRGVNDQPMPSFGSLGEELILTQGGEIGVYHGYTSESGVFWDSVLRGGVLLSDLEEGVLENYFISLSQELGYHWEKEKWHIQPKAHLSLSYLGAQSLTQRMQTANQTYTLTSKQRALWDFRSKLGAEVGYMFGNEEEGVRVGLGGFYVFDGFSGGEIELQSEHSYATLSPYASNHQGLLTLTLKAFLQEQAHLLVEFERSFGGKLIEEYALNLSLRFALGSSTSAQPNSSPKPSRTQGELLEDKSRS